MFVPMTVPEVGEFKAQRECVGVRFSIHRCTVRRSFKVPLPSIVVTFIQMYKNQYGITRHVECMHALGHLLAHNLFDA